MAFEINIIFEERTVVGFQNGNPDIEGGFEYRFNGKGPFSEEARKRPTTYDFLGMQTRTALVTAKRLVKGEEVHPSFLAWAGYMVFRPDENVVEVGGSRSSREEAQENVGEYRANKEQIIDEALRASEEFIAVAVGVNGELDTHPRIQELREHREELQELAD